MDDKLKLALHDKLKIDQYSKLAQMYGRRAVLAVVWEGLQQITPERSLDMCMAEALNGLIPGWIDYELPVRGREIVVPGNLEAAWSEAAGSGAGSTNLTEKVNPEEDLRTRSIEINPHLIRGDFKYDEELNILFVHDPLSTKGSQTLDVSLEGFPAKMSIHRNDGTVEVDLESQAEEVK